MRYGSLSDHFVRVAAKRLAVVEADTRRSNQHEFNGVEALRNVLGPEEFRNRSARFIWLGGENEGVTDTAPVSWYDSRRNQPHRSSEWRLYFKANAVMELAAEGDLLVIGLRPDGELLFIVAPERSTLENQIAWLFGLDGELGGGFRFASFEGREDRGLDFVANYVLEELGIEPAEPEADLLDRIVADWGREFPPSRELSAAARRHAVAPDPREDADGALMGWMEFEEALFRRLERRVVAERLGTGFATDGEADVDGFLSFSLSVQNRRKSRMGLSLENHVEAVLTACGIRHERGARTEGNSRPDFLFPSSAAYRDPCFDPLLLSMLGVKSTLKDRWRQVLAEAARIERKHLLTLEPGISVAQTDEMIRNALQLVVPAALHRTFTTPQAAWLMDFRNFLGVVAERQARADARG
ncbi:MULTISPECIES: type II restriction endonuclease [unclassified Paracoccus (in: a-proteobacteria)]|uniref:type II restriction endonuclease n=1 Tax=unclassified Paracoccus (in: a-proteobacteria) TaxID=2688777 RepID=UPI00135573B9|nr:MULTISPECIES: type II restriction endonuclease [unclassified Paracoccus (in: a-proteobacteria)]UXU75523.1 type II restriction endonuclease [Paracoccus sp. SMMA_5]UXU81428.1 type II restriction endonuclease [Paracoccus sp. SMMA_5_TC]